MLLIRTLTEELDFMPRRVTKDNNRIALREAQSVIEEHEHVKLTHRDSLKVLELLANPPAPNAKLRKAARAIRKRC